MEFDQVFCLLARPLGRRALASTTMGFSVAKAGFRSVSLLIFLMCLDTDRAMASVNFPGAVNSKFTTNLSFERPSMYPAIPTYRIMDSDGIVVDKARAPEDVSPEEAIKMYTNMLTGESLSELVSGSSLIIASEYHGRHHV